MLVSMVPTVQIEDCGKCEMYCSLMSSPSLSFPHAWELRCGEAPERLNSRLLLSRVKHGGGSVMVWSVISRLSLLCLMGYQTIPED